MVATQETRRSRKVMICPRAPAGPLDLPVFILTHADCRRHVIHTVGPIYSSSKADTKAEQLASCYKTSLELAVAHSLKHIV